MLKYESALDSFSCMIRREFKMGKNSKAKSVAKESARERMVNTLPDIPPKTVPDVKCISTHYPKLETGLQTNNMGSATELLHQAPI